MDDVARKGVKGSGALDEMLQSSWASKQAAFAKTGVDVGAPKAAAVQVLRCPR